MAPAVSRRSVTAEARLRVRIFGGQSGTRSGFYHIPSGFPFQYLSKAAEYSCTIWGMDKGPVRGPAPQIDSLTPS
jgi:hypothetical protein